MCNEEENNNIFTIDASKILASRPDLTKDSLQELPLKELLSIQRDRINFETIEKTKDAEFVRKCKKFYGNYRNFTKYVPESIILMGLAKCKEENIWEEKNVWKLPYNKDSYELVEEKKKWDGRTEYTILQHSDFKDYQCDYAVVREILLYYYPEINNFFFKIYTFNDVFDCFYIYSYDKDENKESLYVSLIDIIMGDVEAIINSNIEKRDSSSRNRNYVQDRNKFFKQDYVMDFLDLIKNKRNPDAIVLNS